MSAKSKSPYSPFKIASSSAESFNFHELSKSLQAESSFETEGRAAATIAKSDNLTIVLTVIKQGYHLKQHTAPSAATVIALEGKLSFSISDGMTHELSQHNSVVFAPDVPHALEALEDSIFLIIIGGRANT